jgi:asparagine synthase (glutamine-hydrolysing)
LIFIGNETFFKNILSFPAGYYGIITKKGIKLTKYWDSKYSYEEKNPDELKKILDQSVKRQMISDVPIGAFLSGGIDSSAIAALANNRSRDLKTFTAGFENYPEEIKAAEFVSNELGTKQYNILVKQEDFIKELPKLIWHYDGPISFASSVPLYFVSKLTKKKAKVVLTGEGSDELFAGYKRYYLIKRAIELNRLIGKVPFSRFISKFSENNLADPRYIKIIDLAVNGINYDFLTGINALIGKERDLLLKSNGNELFKSEVEKIFNEKKTNLINQLLYLDFKTYLVELLMKQDKMSMAASIESRVPFLDNKVIDFANKLPERSKLNGRIGKYILRESVKSILPESVIKRKKIGFSVPLNNWFKKDLNGYLKDELNNKLINRFFDTKYINKLIDKQKKSNCSLQLWALLNFNIWYKQNFENEQE